MKASEARKKLAASHVQKHVDAIHKEIEEAIEKDRDNISYRGIGNTLVQGLVKEKLVEDEYGVTNHTEGCKYGLYINWKEDEK